MILPDEAIHAVDIFAFVRAEQIPAHYFDERYCLAPAPGDDDLYADLRDALRREKKVGIAYVRIGTRQHLATLVPCGSVLALNTLRWCSSDMATDACADGHDLPDTPERNPCLPAQQTDPHPHTVPAAPRHERRDRKPRARPRRSMT